MSLRGEARAPVWFDWEIELLRKVYPLAGTRIQAILPGRTPNAIRGKAMDLRIEGYRGEKWWLQKREWWQSHCRTCGKELTGPYKPVLQFCSHVCSNKNPERRAKMSLVMSEHKGWHHSEEAKESIRQGMLFSTCQGVLPRYHPNLIPSPALAYIAGVLIGDGSVGHRAIHLMAKDSQFVTNFANALKSIGLPTQVKYSLHKKGGGFFRVVVRSSEFIRWWDGDKRANALASACPADFVRGFYESDGSWCRNPNLCNSEPWKLELAHQALAGLGFDVSDIRCYIKPGIGIINKKPMYHFYLRGGITARERFLDIIAPCIKKGEKRRKGEISV